MSTIDARLRDFREAARDIAAYLETLEDDVTFMADTTERVPAHMVWSDAQPRVAEIVTLASILERAFAALEPVLPTEN